MTQPLILHCNYVEQGQTIDTMCEKAVRWGFDGIEFRSRRDRCSETPQEYLDAIARAQKKHGLRCVIFGSPGPDFMQPDPAFRRKELEEWSDFYRLAARRFEMTVNNVMSGSLLNPDKNVSYWDFTRHGSYIATEDHYAWAADGFKALGQVAAECGFRFAFETHMAYLHDIPESAMKLVRMINHPSVGVNLDMVNVVHMPSQPTTAEAIRLIGDRLYYVHLKNTAALASGHRLRVGLGDGDFNNREFLRLLREHGYQGPICIEAPRAGDREWFALQDMTYLKSVLADLG